MPIVFDQVDATVTPTRGDAAQQQQAPQPASEPDSPEERADVLRHALCVMAERALRLKAD